VSAVRAGARASVRCDVRSAVPPSLLGERSVAPAVAAIVASIGRDDFTARLVGLLAAAGFDQCNVFSVDDAGSARPFFYWNRSQPLDHARRVRRYVEEGLFAQDPALRELRGRRPDALRPRFFRSEEIADRHYRHYFFEEAGLGGKIAAFERNAADQVYANLYVCRARAWPQSSQLESLLLLADIVLNSILKHRELDAHVPERESAGRLDLVRRLLARGSARLSSREIEVCARQLAGQTSEAIALEFGIAESSVATYRKRAYEKLGICSRNDLFALCLSAARTRH